MGEILPDGSIQGYFGKCPKCGKDVEMNIQGNIMGNHKCESKKFRVNPETKKLEQQPEMKEPPNINMHDLNSTERRWVNDKWVAYKEHIASLKSYDISGSIPQSWLSGRDIEESEFELKETPCCEFSCDGTCEKVKGTCYDVAVPVIKQEQPKPFDYELMDKQIKEIFPLQEQPNETQDEIFCDLIYQFMREGKNITILKKSFTITRKTN